MSCIIMVKWGQNLAKNVPAFNLGHALSLGNFQTISGRNKMTLDYAVSVWTENFFSLKKVH